MESIRIDGDCRRDCLQIGNTVSIQCTVDVVLVMDYGDVRYNLLLPSKNARWGLAAGDFEEEKETTKNTFGGEILIEIVCESVNQNVNVIEHHGCVLLINQDGQFLKTLSVNSNCAVVLHDIN